MRGTVDQFRHSTGRLRAWSDDIVRIGPRSHRLTQAYAQPASGWSDESRGWATVPLECSFAGGCR